MQHVIVENGYESWRQAARALLQQGVAPDRIHWRSRCDTQSDLMADGATSCLENRAQAVNTSISATGGVMPVDAHAAQRVPREFLRLSASVACHSADGRWHSLYRVLYRLTHGEPSLLEVAIDPDVNSLFIMDKAVRRDVHKMHAFVRFRAVNCPDVENVSSVGQRSGGMTRYVAWFEPAHHIVQRASPFFARRFASMHWSILTPAECAHWDGNALQFSAGLTRAAAPGDDELEELWLSYYAHTFNPARLATATMQAEMPQRYWVNLPEAPLIAILTREAPARVRRMLQQLDSPPAEIPIELRSTVGDANAPSRSISFAPSEIPAEFDAPGTWDVVHDPGVSVAQARVASVACAATGAGVLTIDDTQVRIGTASWTDPTLLRCGAFYPQHVTTPETRLRHYASQFPVVEIDSTFYVPPTRAMAAHWAARTPDDFVFDVKAYALMTGHAAETKRIPDWLRRLLPRSVVGAELVREKDLPTRVIDDVWERFHGALSPLKDAGKLGPILLQYPRWFVPTRENANVLRVARERLGTLSAAVEFRNPAWVEGTLAARTCALLEKLNLTYVVVDAPPGTGSSMPPLVLVTTPDLSVVRLHGRRTDAWEARHTVVSERYRYLYDNLQLREWTGKIGGLADMLRQAKSGFPDMAKAKQGVHVVFNNCHANYGTSNATEITKILIEFDKVRRE